MKGQCFVHGNDPEHALNIWNLDTGACEKTLLGVKCGVLFVFKMGGSAVARLMRESRSGTGYTLQEI
jgi:hypothetical protein